MVPSTLLNSVMSEPSRAFGFFKGIDIPTVFAVAGIFILGVFIYDVITYILAVVVGSSSTYSSYGRQLAIAAAKAWNSRDNTLAFDNQLKGRSLETVNDVIDTLASAIMKWEDSEVVGNSGDHIVFN